MKCSTQLPRLLLIAVLFSVWPLAVNARSYSSGGGHSYSSHSSSSSGSHSSSSTHSFSSPSHSFSSGGSSSGSSSHSSSSGSSSRKSSSSSGKSYSSGSSSDDGSRRSYSSGKSYSSGSNFSSSSKHSSNSANNSSSASDDFNYDTAAARARKEQASKDTFTHYNDSRNPPPIRNDSPAAPPVIPRTSSTRAYHDTVYIPDATTLSTRSVRVQNVFHTYYMRPIVRYRDPYSSLFWWWLLDQSLDDRAMWTYNHRADMDAERYQALLNQDAQLQARVEQLEAQQTPADPNYVPANLDRDLMYSDEHLQHTYSTRPTRSGSAMFVIFATILVGGAFYFFVWLVFFHRWQSSSQPST